MTYRDQILSALEDLRWDLVQVDTDGDWWLDERWTLRSSGEAYGREVFVTFVVDPQWEGNRKKGQGIFCVRASHEPLENWNDQSTEVASICMAKRRFEDKLAEFKSCLLEYQRSAG